MANIERAAQTLAQNGLLEMNTAAIPLPPPIRDFQDGDEWSTVNVNSYSEGDELL